MGLKEAVLETLELEVHGETAIETGHYALKADGGAVADLGEYIVIWKNDGGTWKLHKDICNTSQPAAQAMSVSPGTSIGHHDLAALLGEGEVWADR